MALSLPLWLTLPKMAYLKRFYAWVGSGVKVAFGLLLGGRVNGRNLTFCSLFMVWETVFLSIHGRIKLEIAC